MSRNPNPASGGSPGSGSGLSRRRRRLRNTVWFLVVVGGVGLLILGVWALRNRPVPYRPDERSEDITQSLATALPPDAPRPGLRDVTKAAGLSAFRTFDGDRTSQIPEDMGAGVAWGDFDNDGWDDLLCLSAGGALGRPAGELLPCVLYRNQGDGTFLKVEAFPELRIHGMGAAWGDYDGDGYLDLVITGYNTLILLHNEGGTGRFVPDERFGNRPGFWSGASWGDYDHDRRLDLYVCNYLQYEPGGKDSGQMSDQAGTSVPYTLNPSSYAPGLNALFHQNADGTFTDVAAGLKVQNPEGRSLGAVWHDFDQDGWLDLYVANDLSDNVFYHNVGGRFEDISHAALVADYRSAMGLAVGDFDRDGDDDLHITHWVAQENALYENMWMDLNGPGSGTNAPAAAGVRTNGGALFPLRFMDVADRRGLGQIALPFVGWGTEFVDLDQDGWLDLLVVNGSTLELEGPRPRRLKPEEPFVFWNRRGQSFHNLAPLDPVLNSRHVSRGLACADFDGDGAMDFVVSDLGEGVRLFRNEMARGHWLKLRLRSLNAAGKPLGSAEGATVIAHVGGVPLRRSVTGVSYLSQSSHTLHWGLGAATRVDRLEVRWSAGGTNYFEGVAADAYYELREGGNELQVVPIRRPVARAAGGVSDSAAPVATAGASEERRRQVEFWAAHRAGMNSMKVDHDSGAAVAWFRKALALDPAHEDARYYLGLCLAQEGDVEGALRELDELRRRNPQSHRAWQQWGVLRAAQARVPADLVAAESSLLKARSLNPEETGALLVLGEVALLRGERVTASQRFEAVTASNPRSVPPVFFRGYLAWKQGRDVEARGLLEQARGFLGPDWKPAGTTAEGDVQRRQHVEQSPLQPWFAGWNGGVDPALAYGAMDRHLEQVTSRLAGSAPK